MKKRQNIDLELHMITHILREPPSGHAEDELGNTRLLSWYFPKGGNTEIIIDIKEKVIKICDEDCGDLDQVQHYALETVARRIGFEIGDYHSEHLGTGKEEDK